MKEKAEALFKQFCQECGMDANEVRTTKWYPAGMIDYTEWLLEKLQQPSETAINSMRPDDEVKDQRQAALDDE